MYFIKALIIFSACLAFTACSYKPLIKEPVNYGYEKEGVRIYFFASKPLNFYDQNPHALTLCIYQLYDPNGFNQLKDEENGFSRLLECNRFDSSVAFSQKIILQPGEGLFQNDARAENAKYIGVVAGYYDFDKNNATRLYPVPIDESKHGKILLRKIVPLNLPLYFDSQKIEDFYPIINSKDKKKKKNKKE